MDNLTKLNLDNYKPLRDVVFENLRKAILEGQLKPGQRLMEVQLAEQLGVSRTPVREAIRKLELEGLVVMLPRKGAYVANMSLKDIVDVLEGWVEFLRDPESEVVRKLEMTNKEIREAKDELYRLSMDEKERALYFMREKSIRDEISALANAEEKGIKKGRKEEQIKIAKSLLDVLDVETIALKTGLSIEEVNNLKGIK